MDKYLTSFLIGFSTMFSLHYFLEPTWGLNEPRPRSLRLIINYMIGTVGIGAAFLYIHPEMWFDLLISVSGAATATIMAHSRDWVASLWKRDQANGLIERTEK